MKRVRYETVEIDTAYSFEVVPYMQLDSIYLSGYVVCKSDYGNAQSITVQTENARHEIFTDTIIDTWKLGV